MASIQARTSRGKKYWSIVESRRINGKPRTVILAYLGTADSLLKRLQQATMGVELISYSHGDTRALLHVAEELDVINTINQHVPKNRKGDQQIRDGLNVGASLLLAAIGRACRPTSKMAWSDWSQSTSLEYCLRASLKKLDSQHFWEQMNTLPIEAISSIEEALVKKLCLHYKIKPDCLFFDTTNFFTFIDSSNEHCNIPKRGKNKQKRYDLRQIGMSLLVTRKEQFPLFHCVYEGNKADCNVFKEGLQSMLTRLRQMFTDVSDITLVFDKGNNSKENFSLLDNEDIFYVAGLVPSYFKSLLEEANKHFSTMKIEDETVAIFRLKRTIWGQERSCIITISTQFKEGQIRGIEQHLEKKYKLLNELKQKLDRQKPGIKYKKEPLIEKLKKIIKGQFIEEILKFSLIEKDDKYFSFNYYLDGSAFEKLKENILGRQMIVSNRHDWKSEEIIKAYRGQCKVEYAFRTLKNPHHLAIRPQYHWTDQKIRVHFLLCIIAYLLTVAIYNKVRTHVNYAHNLHQLMDDLSRVRLACITKKQSKKVNFQLEKIPQELKKICNILAISDDTLRSTLSSQLSVTTSSVTTS